MSSLEIHELIIVDQKIKYMNKNEKEGRRKTKSSC
jgi:hypothetical protein